MTVQMIRCDIQDRTDIWAEIHNGLQLEAGNFCYRYRIILCFHRHLGIRDTNVANHENTFIVCFHDLPGQRCRCRLAIGSGDGCQSALRALICQLDLTPDWDLGFIQHCHKWRLQRNSRTDHTHLHA